MTRRISTTRARCHPDQPDAGRGLCNRCYKQARTDGSIADHPRQRPTLDEWVDDYKMLTAQGYGHRHIAERLGVTMRAVQRRVRHAESLGKLPAARPVPTARPVKVQPPEPPSPALLYLRTRSAAVRQRRAS